MLAQTEGLLILQDRDRRLRTLAEQLERLPAEETRAKTQLDSDTHAVEHAKRTLQENEIESKKVEIDVETRRTTIIRLTKQQFETRKNDEYQALAHEIVRYGEQVDELETHQLEFMELADGLRAALSSAQAALTTTSKLVDEDLTAIVQRRQRIIEETAEAQTERDRLAKEVDPTLLFLYDRLLINKNGLAVAPLKGEQCGGCHVKLIPATLIKVHAENEIVQCENCARILFNEP